MSRCSLRTALAGAFALAVAACGGSAADQTIEPSPHTSTSPRTPKATPSPVGEGAATPSPVEDAATEPPGSDAGAACSAGELLAEEGEPPGLSDAAAETWAAVREAALACDYGRLAGIAGRSDDFTYSFGDGDGPASHWRQLESRGRRPMAELVEILGLPAAQDPEGNWVWPRVHIQPEDDRAWEELREIHPPEAIQEWREGGAGYLGYRTAVSPEGDWLYFVAGD